ncbi:hypothetical protein FHX42_001491 [Saccharopolyspora lacisalsi]|uniref:Uncharacterized protein n=1 Tax=Halosaccharopolyspora lacisalsi TaxID=1000566 RepID=A0A839DQ96_9PSEU|nr:hypothetical protein [Halosaccharopolyspora lacisalsi]
MLRGLAHDPLSDSATVLTACSPEHLQTLCDGLLLR